MNGTSGIPTTAIFRSATVSKITVFALAATLAIIAGTTFATSLLVPAPRFGWGMGAFWLAVCAFILWNFYRLEVTFDGRRLVFRYGLFAKRVNVADIQEITPTTISWWRYGGVGIRKARGGWAWITGSGPGVKVVAGGKTYYANCEQAETLVALVNNYRGAPAPPK